jgi:P-type Mg2+ transporter
MAEAAPFWTRSPHELLRELESSPEGLGTSEAARRLRQYGPNRLKPGIRSGALVLFLSQFSSPIILILLFAAGLSFFLQEPTDAIIILSIIFLSGLLGFWQEKGATRAVEKLLQMIQIKAEVLRGNRSIEIAVEEVVPGDIVLLNAGDNIPGDSLILESKDLFVDEAVLTGESYPAEKAPGVLSPETPLAQRTNALFLGTHVVSGTAKALVVKTGKETQMGEISERLAFRPPETEFEHGVRRFGYFLMEVTLLLVIAIFGVNVFLHRPVLESILFSLALAVGLTPQLLPAIISVNLAHGAKRMARERVIVRRLSSIENLGSMEILCADKTGTLTEGRVQVHSSLDLHGKASEKVLFYSSLNAFFETGFTNPIDEALRKNLSFDLSAYRKLDEEPYDFTRKRISVLVADGNSRWIVTKGALKNVLEICSQGENSRGAVQEIAPLRREILEGFEDLSRKGFRVLGVAVREVPSSVEKISKEDEREMVFLGFLVLADPPKPQAAEAIARLRKLGVTLKIITGDNRRVAEQLARTVGFENPKILTGSELRRFSDEALLHRSLQTDLFVEVEPNQKEKIILALRKSGHVVGYLGDGINDASALHTADVGISVDQAVDVVKEAATIVLLEKDLHVLVDGVREGRRTFANTLKYVFMATSANFGNMFSMAGASLFLPFLPLLPKQILLMNLLTDLPEMAIATDRVDPEMTDHPHRWNLPFIRRFMVAFGLLSSVFDYLTFAVLLFFLRAGMAEFRTGWFVESIISASTVVLVIRTSRSFFKSRPSPSLFWATFSVGVVTLVLPTTPMGRFLGFQSLPVSFVAAMLLLVGLYGISAELLKRRFFKKIRM